MSASIVLLAAENDVLDGPPLFALAQARRAALAVEPDTHPALALRFVLQPSKALPDGTRPTYEATIIAETARPDAVGTGVWEISGHLSGDANVVTVVHYDPRYNTTADGTKGNLEIVTHD